MRSLFVYAALLACAPVAHAYDAHGLRLIPADANPDSGLLTYGPTPAVPSVTLAAEHSRGHVVRDANGATEGLLTGLSTAHLALTTGQLAPIGGLSFGLSLPLHLTATGSEAPAFPSAGDVRLDARWSLLDPEAPAFASVTALADIPTGPAEGWINADGPRVGALLAVGLGDGPLHIGGHLGALTGPTLVRDQLRGGGQLLAAARVSFSPAPSTWATLELASRSALHPYANRRAESPLEGSLSAYHNLNDAVNLWVAGAAGVGEAVGAPTARVIAGLRLR